MIRLDIDYFASSVYFKSEIWNNNLSKFSECGMVFDTGASMTTIDTKLAIRAGCKLKTSRILKVNTPKGIMLAERIILRDLKLDGYTLGPVLVDVVDFDENSSVLACLGMNVIKHFRLFPLGVMLKPGLTLMV